MLSGRKPFYGWYIVAIAFLSLFVCSGATGFGFSVFLPVMSAELGWPRSTLVLAASIGWGASSLAGPLLGRQIDRHGARVILSAAMVLSAVAVAACGLVQEAWQFHLTFGLLGGLARAVQQNVAPSAMVANWFHRRRSLAFSFAALGPPASSLVYPGIIALAIGGLGWRATWVLLGVSVLALGLPPVALLVRRRPEDLGLLPDGDAPGDAAGVRPAPQATDEDWELREAVRSGSFWGVALGMALVLLTPATVTVFLFPYFYDQGMGEVVAAGTISALSLVQVLSRMFFWGPAIGKLGSVQRVLQLWAVLIFLATLLLQFAHDEFMAYVCSSVLGLAMGGNLVLQMQVWPEYFGRKAVGAITGMAQLCMGASAAGGPLLVTFLVEQSGGYAAPLTVMAASAALGLMLLTMAGIPKRPARGAPTLAG